MPFGKVLYIFIIQNDSNLLTTALRIDPTQGVLNFNLRVTLTALTCNSEDVYHRVLKRSLLYYNTVLFTILKQS